MNFRLILFLLCFCSYPAPAVKASNWIYYRVIKHARHIPQLFVGKKIYQFSYYNQFNKIGKVKIQLPITYAGIGENGKFIISRKGQYYGHIALLFVVPQPIMLDTNACKISGYLFSMSVYGYNLLKRKKIDRLVLSAGFNFGRLRILNNNLVRQKNPVFAPMLSTAYTHWLGSLKLSLNVQYDFDMSKINWKKTNNASEPQAKLNNFNQSGLMAFVCLGYEF